MRILSTFSHFVPQNPFLTSFWFFSPFFARFLSSLFIFLVLIGSLVYRIVLFILIIFCYLFIVGRLPSLFIILFIYIFSRAYDYVAFNFFLLVIVFLDISYA